MAAQPAVVNAAFRSLINSVCVKAEGLPLRKKAKGRGITVPAFDLERIGKLLPDKPLFQANETEQARAEQDQGGGFGDGG
jgi:hypothetical protein